MMNERYDYYEAVKADVLEAIRDQYQPKTLADILDLFEKRDEICDDLWTMDSVTGNASGSYTFSSWKAEENLLHNLDLLGEALEAFGSDYDILKNGAEACDVTIRCYLLGGAIDEALEELAHEALVNELLDKIGGPSWESVPAIELVTGCEVEGFGDWGDLADEAHTLIEHADREQLEAWLEELNNAA